MHFPWMWKRVLRGPLTELYPQKWLAFLNNSLQFLLPFKTPPPRGNTQDWKVFRCFIPVLGQRILPRPWTLLSGDGVPALQRLRCVVIHGLAQDPAWQLCWGQRGSPSRNGLMGGKGVGVLNHSRVSVKTQECGGERRMSLRQRGVPLYASCLTGLKNLEPRTWFYCPNLLLSGSLLLPPSHGLSRYLMSKVESGYGNGTCPVGLRWDLS